MNFYYEFPAVKGLQANNEYYISMVPLKLLSKLFPNDDEIITPENRAQRRINEARIPEIKQYILDNRDTYVFSALSASIDGDFKFISQDNSDIGILKVDMNAVFLINDGQHRKAAIEVALLEDKSLDDETISIVFFRDLGLTRSQQMFTDLNKHAVKTSNSLSTLYNSRDPLAVITRDVIENVTFFRKYTDKERDILGKNSLNLFTLNNIYKANQIIVHGDNCGTEQRDYLIKFWNTVAENINEWQDVLNRQMTKKDLRENYIVILAVTLNALGRLGRFFYENPEYDMIEYLSKLKGIDWLRSNDRNWKGRTINENGKVVNSESAAILTCNKIKTLIGLKLSKEEKLKEKRVK